MATLLKARISGIDFAPVITSAAGLATAADFDQGVADLHRAAEADGVFCYTFFKATAVKMPD